MRAIMYYHVSQLLEGMLSYHRCLLSSRTAHRAKGEIDEAIADFTYAIEINPRHAAAYNSRSKAFEAAGEIDRATADHKKAVEIGLP